MHELHELAHVASLIGRLCRLMKKHINLTRIENIALKVLFYDIFRDESIPQPAF